MSQPTPLQLLDGRRATVAYADLMFTFGFARLGDATTAEHLRAAAARQLDAIETNREFHRLARSAFEFRIAEALQGEPHTGTLDDRCPEVIAALLIDDFKTPIHKEPGLTGHHLTRLLDSVILEPERAFNPYHRIGSTGRLGVAWQPRLPGRDEWKQLIETADSAQAIWDVVRIPHELNHPQMADVYSRPGRYGYCRRLPELLTAARALPIDVVRRFVSVVLTRPPHTGNSFSSAPYFSRIHFAVVDALVLAVVGTGALPPEAERPERLELLRSVRPPVMTWVAATTAARRAIVKSCRHCSSPPPMRAAGPDVRGDPAGGRPRAGGRRAGRRSRVVAHPARVAPTPPYRAATLMSHRPA